MTWRSGLDDVSAIIAPAARAARGPTTAPTLPPAATAGPIATAVPSDCGTVQLQYWNPFTGPIVDQDGKERYAAGVVAPDKDLLGMNWYVKGVDDKLPQ